MDYNDFFAKLKAGEIKRVYLFHGEEELAKEEGYRALVGKVLPDLQELNLSVFTNGSADDIMAACDACPFMADRRVVVLKFIPKDKDADKLIEYIEHMPAETLLIFYIEGKAEGTTKLVKKLKAINAEVVFDFLTPELAAKWVMKHALDNRCTIKQVDAVFMVNLVGRDLLSLKNELQKLCDYVSENGIISREIISDIVIKNLEFQLYNSYSYFISGKLHDGFIALDAITNGRDKDSEAFGIAGYFLTMMKATLVAYDGVQSKASQSELERLTGKRGYALKDLVANAKKFNRQQLLTAIQLFSDVSRQKIMLGRSSYQALVDGIMRVFGGIK